MASRTQSDGSSGGDGADDRAGPAPARRTDSGAHPHDDAEHGRATRPADDGPAAGGDQGGDGRPGRLRRARGPPNDGRPRGRQHGVVRHDPGGRERRPRRRDRDPFDAGSYAETVTVGKALTIQGAEAGCGRPGQRPPGERNRDRADRRDHLGRRRGRLLHHGQRRDDRRLHRPGGDEPGPDGRGRHRRRAQRQRHARGERHSAEQRVGPVPGQRQRDRRGPDPARRVPEQRQHRHERRPRHLQRPGDQRRPADQRRDRRRQLRRRDRGGQPARPGWRGPSHSRAARRRPARRTSRSATAPSTATARRSWSST